ncbi:hypothetical protein DFA_07817 [Cavenderia fasciculata]|uniref:Uncharacterized protein n=1 Tax=Cavenderia fasciculata TaxID=261658 RepID=F4Q3H0_CACFS|nr:uncharacterized protein DFA_07817 [Cavenderia fasciculata]EGG16839.1 hypothetical protein DFA_07817 [Cavenderia fasciculata]|eukprot:XP_004355313.1 hypothetical protein DFA_07817 [Cavenderia fasciculata]
MTNFKSSADRRADSVDYEKNNTRVVCLEVNTAAKWDPSDIGRLIVEFHEPDHPTNQLESLFYLNGMQFQLDRIYKSTTTVKERKSADRVLLGDHEVSYNFFVLLFYFQRGRSLYTRAILGPNQILDGPADVYTQPSAVSPERLNVLHNYTLDNTVLIDSRCQSTNCRGQLQ